MKFFISLFLLSFSLVFAKDLTIAYPVNVGALNPHLYSPNQMFAQVLAYESLVRYGEDGKIEPLIASSWEVSKDGKTYTFFIPKGQKFADGTKLDAYAVEKNFKAIMLNKERHSWLGLTQKIRAFKALDETHFELKLDSAYSATLAELSLPRPYRILAPSAFQSEDTSKGIKKAIGSGAFVLKQTRLGEYDIFEFNPYYRGKKPNFDRLIIKVLPDPNSRVLALQSKGIDLLVGEDIISYENFKRLSTDKNFVTKQSGVQGTTMLTINASKDHATNDMKLRRIIIQAFCKDVVMKGILLNLNQKANQLFHPSLPYADHVRLEKEVDCKSVKAYDKKVSLDLVYIGTNPIQKAIAEALQGDLARVNIHLNLLASEEVSFYQRQRSGDFDLIFNSTWGNPFDPHSFLGSMLEPSHADFMAQKDLANKAEIDKSIRAILNTADEQILRKNYDFVLNALQESYIYLPINYESIFAVYDKAKIKHFEFGAMATEFMLHKIELQE
ncbi:nickel ABC transporter, nickel/metallophore periplasmic binding protein [Campylobacter sp. MIT 19-121]|uniref:nickel ABC transporter substrate-binding protein n=1 Tax=Campylobacter sp. MIT 19-121 TaxID=2703906 RepID=UPI00138A1AE9|nr:nickel ABC transporter substrate-binding protein [Campylobacter sp. MIT 19-121]NDJ27091.1 nickel ABC transporter, nickel/metallophore periplasmic binding protein [Campylobacter sp. MIT 19-121]